MVLKEVEDLRHLVRERLATVMWLSGADVSQVAEVAKIGAPLPVESQLALAERMKVRIAEQMVGCTPHDVATGKADLKGQESEVVAILARLI